MAFGSGFTPTDEQRRIVAAAAALERGASLRVIAYAGAAKTSTCVMIADANPSRRYYYGAFNAKIAREAASRFPSNVTSSTVHALAKRSLDVPTGQIDKRRLNGMVVSDVATALRLDRMTSKVRFLVARTLAAFVVSADSQPNVDHLWSAAAAMGLVMNAKDAEETERRATAVCRTVWEYFCAWRTNKVPLPHDVYLKLFERDEALVTQAFAGYHTAFLDEAQDANPVMRSVFERSGCAVVAVGDPMQSIYAFRGAENALDLLPGEVFELSQSFRFGETIAAAAWAVLQSRPEGAPVLRLRGNGAGGKIVFDRPCRVTLCRSNAGVVRKALSVAASGRNVHVIGGVEELVREVRSAVALHQGRPDDVVADSMRSFRTWPEFTAYAEESMDVGFERLISMVNNGEAANIGLLESRCVGDESQASEVVGTAHKAKGLEWEEVAVADDFVDRATLLRRWLKVTAGGRRDEASKAVLEEFNLTYVALTRAKSLLSLPAALRGFLSGMEILRPIGPPATAVGVRPAADDTVEPVVDAPFGRAPLPRIGFVSRAGLAPHEVDRLLDSLKALGCLVVLSGDGFSLASAAQPRLVGHVLVVPSLVPHLGADRHEAAASARRCASMGMGVASVLERFEIHADEVASFPLFADASAIAPSVAQPQRAPRPIAVHQPPRAPVPVVAAAPFVVPPTSVPQAALGPAGIQGPSNPFTGQPRAASAG